MNWKMLPPTLLAAIILSSCAPGKRSFLTVQMCLTDRQDLTVLIGELRSIANEKHMRFVDASASTQRDLRAAGNINVDKMLRNPVINLRLEGTDGVGLIVGNLGLPRNQVAVGFTEGHDPQEAQRFSRLVVDRFAKRWHLHIVPREQGAKPMSCDNGGSEGR